MAENLPEPGCYVDGHWGQYAVARAIEVAVEQGWEDAEASDLAARHLAAMGPSTEPGLDADDFERLMSAVDDAEAWLNEHRTPEGFYWHWNDGDFGLYAPMPSFFAERGVDMAGLMNCAEQRALRVLMMARGDDPNLTRPTPVRLDAMERAALMTLQSVFIDGFAAALGVEHHDNDPRNERTGGEQ